jgi:hypothetical protein
VAKLMPERVTAKLSDRVIREADLEGFGAGCPKTPIRNERICAIFWRSFVLLFTEEEGTLWRHISLLLLSRFWSNV